MSQTNPIAATTHSLADVNQVIGNAKYLYGSK